MSSRANILLIVIDQFRADLLQGRLAEVASLPNLTALMNETTVFPQHYSVVSPCGPSRVSLLTGQYAMNHRAVRNGTPLRHDTPNLAKSLRAAGYDPLLFGYTDTAQDPRVLEPDDPRLASYEELMPGFTEAVRMRQETDDTAWRDHLRAKGYDVPDGMALYCPVGKTIDSPAIYRAEDSDTAFLTDRFLAHVRDADPGWCAMLTYIRPHPPLVAPAPYNTMYDPAAIPPPVTSADNTAHPFMEILSETRRAASMVTGFPELGDAPEIVQRLRAIYLGLAREVDDHVGRVVRWLKDSGQWEDTILVLTADHGEMLGDFGVWQKSAFMDGAFHVPLMIRAPGLPRAHAIRGMSESVDVAPTILDLAGVEIPDSMDGVSLRAACETGQTGKDHAVSEHDFGDPVTPTAYQVRLGLPSDACSYTVLRTATHRLVHFAEGLPQVLHDMTGDGERRDVSQAPDSAAIRLEMTQTLLSHRMRHAEGTFGRIMVGAGGVRRGDH